MGLNEDKKEYQFPLAAMGIGTILTALGYADHHTLGDRVLGESIFATGLFLILKDSETFERILNNIGGSVRADLYYFRKNILKHNKLNPESLYFSYMHR